MYKNKLFFKILVLLLTAFYFTACTTNSSKENKKKEYGVFLGINSDQIEKLNNYKIVVIEPQEFTKEQISELHKQGKTVYAYLNIGAIENYREYYNQFKEYTLGKYENWEDEYWLDVSAKAWQDYIENTLAPNYVNKGFDGFFLDNADVYYHYKRPEIFQGLIKILQILKNYNVTLIINGGDVFVERCMNKNINNLFDAINQESVFTRINFATGTYKPQKKVETEYFTQYLAKAKQHGLQVYLLEYDARKKLEEKIASYCQTNNFLYYNAKSLELK